MPSSVGIGAMLELSEAIRDYHDLTGFPQMVSMIYMQSPTLFLVLSAFFLSHAVGFVNVISPLLMHPFVFDLSTNRC